MHWLQKRSVALPRLFKMHCTAKLDCENAHVNASLSESKWKKNGGREKTEIVVKQILQFFYNFKEIIYSINYSLTLLPKSNICN